MKKVICKKLRNIASGLPPQVEHLPGTLGVKTLRAVRDKNGRAYFGLMTADVTRVRSVNHYRRLKKAYIAGGQPAVMAYAQKTFAQATKAGYTESTPDVAPVATDPRDQPGVMPAPVKQQAAVEAATEAAHLIAKPKRGRPRKEVPNG